jgi:3-isopropylmalate/(R)-2-methylmalate dehydratase small subunit
VDKGDLLEINFSTGQILNQTKGLTLQAQPLSSYVLKILAAGGIKPLIKMEYGQ